MNVRVAAIIAAAGSSTRMGGIKKEYLPLPRKNIDTTNRLTVLGSAVHSFAASPRVDLIVIAVPAGGEGAAKNALPPDIKKVLFTAGGADRRSSVYNALRFLEKYNPEYVLIHDGARPWIKTDFIEKIIDAVTEYNAVIPLLPMTDTPKEVECAGSAGFIKNHLKRTNIGLAQTPQAFSFREILDAHKKAASTGEQIEFTDDAEIWGRFIGKVMAIPGDPENRKITFMEDLV